MKRVSFIATQRQAPLATLASYLAVARGLLERYEIKYPQMYAEQSDPNAVIFNCYQRAHQNVLENYPPFLLLLGLAAINRPIVAGVAGAIRLAGFVAYVIGYRTGNPEKRHKGAFGYIGLITMLGCAIESAVKIGMS